MKLNKRLLLFTAILVVLATLSKILFAPKLEWSGFSPIYAIALFSGMIVKDKSKSFLYPLIALFLSDAIIQVLHVAGLFPFAGFYTAQITNYALLLVSVLIGWALKGNNFASMFTGAIAAPTFFFLVSNFLVWASHGGYSRPMTFAGLIACFTDGLPFYKNALIATVIYVPSIIGVYNYMVKKSASFVIA